MRDLGVSGANGSFELALSGGHEKEIAADWIVMPRALSAGRKSVTVLPSSTSGVCQSIVLYWWCGGQLSGDAFKSNWKMIVALPPSLRVKPL